SVCPLGKGAVMAGSHSVCFDRAADFYDATRSFPPAVEEEIADAILAAVGATPETHFLEVGIGTGRIALPLIRRGCPYTGIDISERMLAVLRRKIEQSLGQMPPQVHLQMADATQLPYGDRCFDVVITVHVLHLIREWQQAIAEIRRVLKPSGVYLYGYGERVTSARHSFELRWAQILAELGFEPQQVGANAEQVEAFLWAQGAHGQQVTAAEWQTTFTAQALFEQYAQRCYSSSWSVPEAIFQAAIARLQAWFQDTYPNPNAVLLGESRFQMLLARYP
ncbi:class I SAM-dependent methyltransferase, partial [Synechococcus sp. H55.2]|uniref:class I SAM-dependent methyltransferase n=4 Tax=Synechococcus TaxID=1129 RepID=UPI0039C33D17